MIAGSIASNVLKNTVENTDDVATTTRVASPELCMCEDNAAKCGHAMDSSVCFGLFSHHLYQCVTKGHRPVARYECEHGCQTYAGSDDACIPKDTSCTCPDTADHCGAYLMTQSGKNCSELDPTAIYQCSGAGRYPAWRWQCKNGCTQNGVGKNDTCDKGEPNVVGLTKIKHIVIFMQENRAFDNYYGTKAGVANFADPNVAVMENGNPIWYQPDKNSPDTHNGQKYALPFQIHGPKAGCTSGGTNAWEQNHAAWNHSHVNNWPQGNSVAAMGYLTRPNLPFYFELADQFSIADMYFESVMTSTNPNRIVLWSGTIDARGETIRGPVTDNQEFPFLHWETYPEILERAGISWQVYQGEDNFDDNALHWFEQYRLALPESKLRKKGTSFLGLEKFYEDALNGNLPAVSWVVGPTQLSEHPDNGPMAGQWLTQQVVNAVKNSSAFDSTVLIVNYDESGGFFDHVVPPISPVGTIDEWTVSDFIKDELNPVGPGFRVPAFVISPWSTGGVVFTEPTDHTSTIQFIEQWAIANGYNPSEVMSPLISSYRRNTMSDFTHALDFSVTNTSVPDTAPMPMPSQGPNGAWNPTTECEALPGNYTTVPYGNQSFPIVEQGFLKVRGNNPGIGRTYVFELVGSGMAMQADVADNMTIVAQPSVAKDITLQQFIMRVSASNYGYNIVSSDGLCLSGAGKLMDCEHGDNWLVQDMMNGEGYAFFNIPTSQYLYFNSLAMSFDLTAQITTTWTLYSVVPNNY
ncbi:hypothetical protein SAMD00019534_037590 [Acytostelium subglobosum LB1]|uniref:hypothetical protein n=1 Tax=Acytostelium subglobosum LB1 TaxID=1410327 RepID=UPI000644AD1B|nr:hypothetical protein SAMD00019534_037590 [Acytostelium subglobosum LB1]GAM20584.1 hypothetical protein SAMD00019534_037590 [Acytostelium subglobosum LB1]|eukprot:XP_012760105.1 hypothetical protein SAMD00019534_037590 [Acytostelium subglobosum LB1]